MLGQAFDVSEQTQELLGEAIESLIDDIHLDLVTVACAAAGGADTSTQGLTARVAERTCRWLPASAALRFTPRTLKQFLGCLHTVAFRLSMEEWQRCGSLAEEFALRAILHEARAASDGDGRVEEDLDRIQEEAFEDLDFELLFDPACDGIESDAEAVRKLGLCNLAFDDWFAPFSYMDVTAPYAAA